MWETPNICQQPHNTLELLQLTLRWRNENFVCLTLTIPRAVGVTAEDWARHTNISSRHRHGPTVRQYNHNVNCKSPNQKHIRRFPATGSRKGECGCWRRRCWGRWWLNWQHRRHVGESWQFSCRWRRRGVTRRCEYQQSFCVDNSFRCCCPSLFS